MLLAGSGLQVVILDLTRVEMHGPLRHLVVRASYLEDLFGFGTLTRQAAHFLEAQGGVISGLDVLAAGGTRPATRQLVRTPRPDFLGSALGRSREAGANKRGRCCRRGRERRQLPAVCHVR
jgi:hypothetical protein